MPDRNTDRLPVIPDRPHASPPVPRIPLSICYQWRPGRKGLMYAIWGWPRRLPPRQLGDGMPQESASPISGEEKRQPSSFPEFDPALAEDSQTILPRRPILSSMRGQRELSTDTWRSRETDVAPSGYPLLTELRRPSRSALQRRRNASAKLRDCPLGMVRRCC
jgi:hypothetical protein